MPQVPYNPVPQAQPTTEMTPRIGIQTPPAAFGKNIGAALSHLGTTFEGVGNEMWGRAVALQELNNEMEARNATTQYMVQQGKMHADQTSLQGKQAVDGLDPYIDQSTKLRESIANGIQSPQARRMFENESQNFMARNIFSAASHAAQQNKVYQNQTGHALVSAAMQSIHDNPRDTQLFNDGIDKLKDGIDFEVANGTLSPGPIADEETNNRISKMWAARIDGLAKIAPNEARELRDEAQKSGALRGEDIDKTFDYVQRHLFNVGSRNISYGITTGKDIGLGSGVVSMDRAKQAISAIESGGSYSAVTDSKTNLGRALGKYQVMEGELQQQLRDAGLPPMTPEAFLRSPQAQDRVFESAFGGLMQKYGNFNDAASAWLTGLPMDKAGNRADRFGTTAQIYVQKANRELAKTASLSDKQALGVQRANEQDPENPLFADAVSHKISMDHLQVEREQRAQTQASIDTINKAVLGQLPVQQGNPPKTVEEVLALPGIDTAIESLPTTKAKLEMPKMIEKAINDRDQPTNDARWAQLEFIRKSDPERYISYNPIEQTLNSKQQIQMMNQQEQVRQHRDKDPNLASALRTLEPEMKAIGLTKPGKSDDSTAWDQFGGELQDALASEIRAKGDKPLTYEDVRKVGARLLQQTSKGGWLPTWLGGTEDRYFFSEPISDKEMFDKRQQMVLEKPGEPAPTDQAVTREVVRDRYNALYGSKKGNKAPAVPGVTVRAGE